MRENSLEKIYMVIPWGPPVQRLTSFFNKNKFFNNSPEKRPSTDSTNYSP
jgi:hypothetical protein